MTFLDTWLLRILLALFLFAGALKFTKRGQVDADRWGYSIHFLRLVGVVEIAAAVALFWYPYWASAVLLVVMAGALGTSYKHRNWKEMVHPAITAALLFTVLFRNL
ncbi:MAG: DoxX family protein [Thermoplasmatota archaeon]